MIAALLLSLTLQTQPVSRVIDDFESTSGWKTTPSDGVSLEIHEDQGINGKSMRLDFDFHGHGGYAVIHKDFRFRVPANYEFTFSIRGPAPTNTLELKLIDPSGDNVWWSNQPGFVFPARWTTITRKKRHISFAWGPKGGGELEDVAAIEFAITAGTGGKGSVWIDNLRLTPLDPQGPYTLTPKVTGEGTPGHAAALAIDGNRSTSWRPPAASEWRAITVDFLRRREFGGLVLEWDTVGRPADFQVRIARDGEPYDLVYAGSASNSPRDYIYLPESDARYLRITVPPQGVVGLREITVKPLEWSASKNAFLKAVANDSPPGDFPRFFSNKQSYWTVVGVSGDTREGLFDAEGRLETGKAQFTLEPFIRSEKQFISWASVKPVPTDAEGDLPIPSSRWTASPFELTITAYATGEPESSILFGRYNVRNTSDRAQKATLYVAMRPFQVNPPWQFLNTPGGSAPIDSISFDGNVVHVNDRRVIPVSRPVAFGAMSFNRGNFVEALRAGDLPATTSARDNLGLASGALAYALTLAPRSDTVIYVAVPLHSAAPPCMLAGCTARWAAAQLDSTKAGWRNTLGSVQITLPKSAASITQSIRSNLAYILINRDGAAIQPGSRSYERSWIRDGSLTSAALLRLHHYKEVKDFLEWFAPYQFENGKIPCCVDARGSDPVPENDSHGEFIYLVAEYFRHTGDRQTLEKMWPHVAKAFEFQDSLRRSRQTPEYMTGDKQVFRGLMPQSISHEGYSAKPMHSYWDDFFALRGFKDAAFMAETLGKPEAGHYATVRDIFQKDLHASIQLAMKNHRISYIPGAAELGDFDATSTTVGVNPGGELGTALEPAIRRTFEKYYSNFITRRDSGRRWNAYTPYEWRTVGTFIRLGQRQRAHEIAGWFLGHQRPKAWHQWAEVVMEKVDSAQFIGDMPHTWVGSDFIRSVLDMFAYEEEADSSLVLGAGITSAWLREDNGVGIRGLSTHYGTLGYTMRAGAKGVEVSVDGGLRIPRGGIVIRPPLAKETKVTSVPVTLTIPYSR
jgi:hypothetical protein